MFYIICIIFWDIFIKKHLLCGFFLINHTDENDKIKPNQI